MTTAPPVTAGNDSAQNHKVCTPALAERVRKLMCLEPGSLRGVQANYQHDDPKGDGFGRDVALAAVAEHLHQVNIELGARVRLTSA